MAKLLLVEDDNNLREIYEARLQAEGYQIVSAKDGEEALVVAKSEKPDLVISDVMMPKISGFEMLDIMRNTEELKNVKVIMLTALGQSDDQQRADKLGADRYLVKSQVTLEDIVKVAHELLADQGGSAPAASGDNAAKAAETPAAAPAAEEPKPEAAAAAETPAPAAPSPEPAPEPAAKAEAEPSAAAPADSDGGKEAAKPAAEEEADVEAKIEDFVAGASSEPTAPAPAEPAKDLPPVEPAPVQPTPAASTADDAAAAASSDDKLMADAVDDLVASTSSTDSKPDTTAASPTVIPVSVADDKDTAAEPTKPAEETKPAVSDTDKADGEKTDSNGSSHKVIKPLEGETKKDINQLLAEEESKEAQAAPGTVINGGAAQSDDEDRPAGQPPTSPPSAGAAGTPGDVDPNSIAL